MAKSKITAVASAIVGLLILAFLYVVLCMSQYVTAGWACIYNWPLFDAPYSYIYPILFLVALVIVALWGTWTYKKGK